MLYSSTISCAESMAIISELINKFSCNLLTPESQKKLHVKTSNSTDPVTLEYGSLKLPGCNLKVWQHVLWLTPYVALCMQPNLISLVLVFKVSQVEIVYEYPLIVWPDVKTYGLGHCYGPAPMDVPGWTPVTSRKICHVQNIHFFTLFRNKCNFSVHLDTCSYFVGSPVHFEFQTILNMSYEICNFLRTRDMVELLKLVAGSLAAMLRVGLPQLTLFSLFSPGRKGLEDRYESLEFSNETQKQMTQANEQLQTIQSSNNMILLQRITMTIHENAIDEFRTEFPKILMKMLSHAHQTPRNTNLIFRNNDLVNQASAGCPNLYGSHENFPKNTKSPDLNTKSVNEASAGCPNFPINGLDSEKYRQEFTSSNGTTLERTEGRHGVPSLLSPSFDHEISNQTATSEYDCSSSEATFDSSSDSPYNNVCLDAKHFETVPSAHDRP